MLSYGMPYDLFWKGPPGAIWHYIDKHKIDQQNNLQMTNWKCYLQGQYFYKSLCCVAPVLVSFPKKNARVEPYPEKPFDLHAVEEKEEMTPELIAERNSLMAYFNMKMLEADVNPEKILFNGVTEDGE